MTKNMTKTNKALVKLKTAKVRKLHKGKVQLMLGDCLKRMKAIPDKSIDMILCDLPYGTTACKWDSVIPFEPLWEQYKRIIKNRGAIVLFGAEPFSSKLVCSNITMFKYSWKWNKIKPSMFFNAKNAPMKKIEDILVFSFGTTANKSNKRMNYYPQGLVVCGKKRPPKNDSVPTQSSIGKRPSRSKEYTQEFTNYPCDLLEFVFEKNPIHPTQKPVVLLEYLIKTYTLENETVLDNTMGSGSTGIACLNTKRNFIGIEKDKPYYKKAKQRIKTHIVTSSSDDTQSKPSRTKIVSKEDKRVHPKRNKQSTTQRNKAQEQVRRRKRR